MHFYAFFIYISIQIRAGFNVGVCHTLVEREQLHDGGGSAPLQSAERTLAPG